MFLNILIVVGVAGALLRGMKLGLVRQLCSTAGFFVGLLIGAWAEPHLIHLVHGVDSRAIFTVAVILGTALVFLTAGEYAGRQLKYHVIPKKLYPYDSGMGALLGILSLFLAVWLMAAIISGSSAVHLKKAVRGSWIISRIDRVLPPAPEVIAKLGHLIDPNGFPDVFIGDEPVPHTPVNLPSLGELAGAVTADRDSVVRIKGQGCGGIVSGSGFVVRPGLVATNAHVVAGIGQSYVQDGSGSHTARVVWFDPDLDFALLKADGLSERSLKLDSSIAGRETPVAVLGYPGGGNFSAKAGLVLNRLKAGGRNIYGTKSVVRDVYEVHTDIVPGNSGGPLVGRDGRVIGVVFAESTSYNHVGYALISDHLDDTIDQAARRGQTVGTGACAE